MHYETLIENLKKNIFVVIILYFKLLIFKLLIYYSLFSGKNFDKKSDFSLTKIIGFS